MENGKGKKRVLISGAGIAGIICAILLDKNKYEVEITEQADQHRNIGFSIILWKTGFHQLLSLLEKNSEELEEGKDCFKVEGFKLFAGSRLVPLKQFNALGYAWSFNRSRLMEILEKILHQHLRPKQILFSRSIRHIEYAQDHDFNSLVTFRDGTKQAYDIIIIAEGSNSSSRELVAVKEQIVSNSFVVRYVWFASPTNLGNYGALFLTEGQLAVIHPPYFKNLLGFYFDKGVSREDQIEFENAIRTRVKQMNGHSSLLDLKTSEVFELKEVHLDRYHAKNVVFVGDAAHARPPTLGFGTSLAIEDAVQLSHMLNSLKIVSETEITGVFQSYSDIRSKRVEEVYHFQNQIQKFYTKSHFKVLLFSFLIKVFLGKYMEYRTKRLASYKIL